MKYFISLIALILGLEASGQKKTTLKSGWITEPEYYYSKSGKDMDYTDTLEIIPLNKAWQMCCLNLTPDCPNTLLFDIGVYHEKSQSAQTLKGGIGMYFAEKNTIVTVDYHHTIQTGAQAFGFNWLKQGPEVVISKTTIRFYPFRAGFNMGMYKPKNMAARPYAEPKLGLVMPFGRGHIYASYRFVAGNNEIYNATKGWNFGSTTLFNF
jgi:hypothetical protein